MSVFKKIAQKLFGGKDPESTAAGFFLNVRCSACGEAFHLFVNTSTELSRYYEDERPAAFFLRKEIIGSRCSKRIQVQMDFDGAKRLLSRKIENGEFMDDPQAGA